MSNDNNKGGGSHSHHGDQRRKKNKKTMVLSGVISLFISLCMVFILISVLLRGGLLNEKLFRQTLSESVYYDNKINEMRQSVNEKLELAGLPVEIGDDVITSKIITIDINKKVRGGEQKADDETVTLEKSLRENINSYLVDSGVVMTEDVRKSVDVIVAEIAKDYDTHMTFLFAKLYNQFNDKYAGIFDIVIYVSAAVLAACSVVAVFLHSRKYRGLRYVGYGILSGSIVTEAVALIMKTGIKGSLPDKNTEYYNVINSFINKSFSQGIYMCLAGMLLFCLVSLLTYYLKKQVI